MCFSIKKTKNPVVKIATRNLIRYKEIRNDMCPLFYPTKEYEFGKIYNAEHRNGKKIRNLKLISPIYSDDEYYINEGIHTYRKLPNRVGYHNIIIKCIIPKGTKYIDNTKESVSISIIPVEYINIFNNTKL